MSGIGRPPIPLGAGGTRSARELARGKWRAVAWYRDHKTGKRRQITATGPTKAAALANLDAKILTRGTGARGATVTPETTVRELVHLWLKTLPGSERAEQTISRYKHTALRTIVPALGDVFLREMHMGMVTTLLRQTAIQSPSEARVARAVLKGLLGLAVESDAIPQNYAAQTGVTIRDPHRKATRALDVASAERVFSLVAAARDRRRPGPATTKAHDDLLDILGAQLGAQGLRISEAAAITAGDIDWDSSPPLLHIHQAVIYRAPSGPKLAPGRYEQPGAYVVQAHTKKADQQGDAGSRYSALAPFAVTLLANRVANAGVGGLLFHSGGSGKGPLNLNNLRRTLRDALRGSEFEGWASTHTMRRTVGTAVKDERGLGVAQEVLRHRHSATTEASYVEPRKVLPDVSGITQRFGRFFEERDASS